MTKKYQHPNKLSFFNQINKFALPDQVYLLRIRVW